MKTPIIRFRCPHCSRPIEAAERVAKDGVRCPDCNTGFVPDKFDYVIDQEKILAATPPETTSATVSIENNAELLSMFAWVLLIVSIICGAIAAASKAENLFAFAAIASGCFSLALVLFILAQLLRIRAELVRANETKLK